MKKKALACILLAVGVGFSAPTIASPMFTSTSSLNGSTGGGDYTNASSIPVINTDLIEGSLPLNTNYVGTNEAVNGTLGVLTDGTTGAGASDPTTASNAAFDLNNGNWYAEYDLGSSKAIGSIVVTTGHQDFRINQHYDLLLSNDGMTFTSLSDSTTQALGTAGVGFNYTPSDGSFNSGKNFGGAAQTTVADDTSSILGTARYVEFVAQANGEDVYRELDVVSATPEPASIGLLGLGTLGLLARRRRQV